MKKIYYLLLSAAMVVTSACSKDNLDESSGQSASSPEIMRFHGVATPEDGPQTRGIAQRSKLWQSGTEITVKFLNDPYNMKSKVMTYAKEWENHANIKFKLVTTGNADVRIGFNWNDERYVTWSYIGTDCLLNTNQDDATMSFAYFNEIAERDRKADVLRAFGQVLGLELEHRHLAFTPGWTSQIQKYWESEITDVAWSELRKYVFDRIYTPSTVVQTDRYDAKSIMVWPFLARYATNTAREANYQLSEEDKAFVKRLYPEATLPITHWRAEKVDAGPYIWGVGYNPDDKSLMAFSKFGVNMSTDSGQSWTLQQFTGDLRPFGGPMYLYYVPAFVSQGYNYPAMWYGADEDGSYAGVQSAIASSLGEWETVNPGWPIQTKSFEVQNSVIAMSVWEYDSSNRINDESYKLRWSGNRGLTWIEEPDLVCYDLYACENNLIYALCQDGIYALPTPIYQAGWIKMIDFAELGITPSPHGGRLCVEPYDENMVITFLPTGPNAPGTTFIKVSEDYQYVPEGVEIYPTSSNVGDYVMRNVVYGNGYFIVAGNQCIRFFSQSDMRLMAEIYVESDFSIGSGMCVVGNTVYITGGNKGLYKIVMD